jgi:hypothetical protein
MISRPAGVPGAAGLAIAPLCRGTLERPRGGNPPRAAAIALQDRTARRQHQTGARVGAAEADSSSMRPESGDSQPERQPPRPADAGSSQAGESAAGAPWRSWLVLALFTFLAFECVLLALALRGTWLILIAPGVVCGVKAWDTWRAVRPSV